MNILDIKDRYEELKEQHLLKVESIKNLKQTVLAKEKEIESLKTQRDHNDKVNAILQDASEVSRNTAKTLLEGTVTNALQFVTGQDYEFEIEITEKANKPNAELYIVTDIGNGEKARIRPYSCGGGFVDIISTSIRFGYVELLNNPKIYGPIFLDEPSSMVSDNYSVKFAEFIKDLSDHFGRQCFMVTHDDSISSIADKCFEVKLNNDKISVVKEV